ncbi:MAG: anhydro-N-acetylmuramic acid kinase [Pseudomonadota bacterium]
MAVDGLYVGLMSGTSMDGIDAVLLGIRGGRHELLKTHSQPYAEDLLRKLRLVAGGDADTVDDVARLDRHIALAFAAATNALLRNARTAATGVAALGSHGQTVRHRPTGDAAERFTLQLGDPSTIAEETGIRTVADFRRRDLAAGGEGAPLVPAFHAAAFGAPGELRAIVNVGGIANATLLEGTGVRGGFDCGPGNTLLDAWIRLKRGEDYDAGGAWSGEHEVDESLLGRLLEDGYFHRQGPRSTGPELFNLEWLDQWLGGDEDPGAVQATLCELSAVAIEQSLAANETAPHAVYVCGGGARNIDLMRRLSRRLDRRGIRLGTTDELGMAAEWVEAAAFAWLAHRCVSGLPGNAPEATGASGHRILGGIYQA